eukprot:763778-Hanusia_phi.AAC.4
MLAVESAAPTRSSTGGMQRDTGAAGRCADWVQKLVNQVRPQLELSCSSGEAAVRAPDEEALSTDLLALFSAQGTEASGMKQLLLLLLAESTDRSDAARLEESLAVKRLPTRGGAGEELVTLSSLRLGRSGREARGQPCPPLQACMLQVVGQTRGRAGQAGVRGLILLPQPAEATASSCSLHFDMFIALIFAGFHLLDLSLLPRVTTRPSRSLADLEGSAFKWFR